MQKGSQHEVHVICVFLSTTLGYKLKVKMPQLEQLLHTRISNS